MGQRRFCPACKESLFKMSEPHQYGCFYCRKVWRIHDVIAEAYEDVQDPESMPGERLQPAVSQPSLL
jgi:hypothetical protein